MSGRRIVFFTPLLHRAGLTVLAGADNPQLEARSRATGATRLLAKSCDNAVLPQSIRAALGGGT